MTQQNSSVAESKVRQKIFKYKCWKQKTRILKVFESAAFARAKKNSGGLETVCLIHSRESQTRVG